MKSPRDNVYIPNNNSSNINIHENNNNNDNDNNDDTEGSHGMAKDVVAGAKADADGDGPQLIEAQQQTEVVPGKHEPAVHHEQGPEMLPQACLDLPLVWFGDVELDTAPATEHW